MTPMVRILFLIVFGNVVVQTVSLGWSDVNVLIRGRAAILADHFVSFLRWCEGVIHQGDVVWSASHPTQVVGG